MGSLSVPKSQTPAARLRSGPSVSTCSKGSGHRGREALAPNSPQLGSVEGGREEAEKPVGGGSCWKQDFLETDKGRSAEGEMRGNHQI